MTKHLIVPLLLLLAQLLQAQAYTEKLYDRTLEKDLVYGTAVNYLGRTDTLTLDLYTPLNSDTRRPLAVLVHGGSWLSGCKEDMAWLCEELAARGYTVATVNYRKGWHKDDYVANPVNPALIPWGNCLYALDSTEILRAIYRGMQDVKGAIRWLKAREFGSPDCAGAVLVGGESAGAFISLAVGVLDRPEEKPPACGALPDAPAPDSRLSNCFSEKCALVEHAVSPGALMRPDLGPVDGTLNQNGFDAEVAGVMSFYGAVPEIALTGNWMQGPDTPAFYLYHQTCDGVVPFRYGYPMWAASAYCNLGFTPWHYSLPHVYGNGAIADYLAALPDPPPYLSDFLPCDGFNSDLALFECIRYNDNGSYHYTHNRPERAVKLSAFFSPIMETILNQAPCAVATAEPDVVGGIRPAPNPFREQVGLYCESAPDFPVQLILSTAQGQQVFQSSMWLHTGFNTLPCRTDLPAGIYTLFMVSEKGATGWKLIRQ